MDIGDARGPRLRGWGRYVRELSAALRRRDDLELHELAQRRRGSGGWLGTGRAAARAAAAASRRRARAELLPAAVAAVPRRRDDPRPRVRGVPGRLRAAHAREVPLAGAARRAVGRARDLRQRVHARRRVRALRRRPGAGRASCPTRRRCRSGPRRRRRATYLLGVGDLRAKKNWRRLVRAWRALRAEGLPHRLVIAGEDAGEAAALRELAGRRAARAAGLRRRRPTRRADARRRVPRAPVAVRGVRHRRRRGAGARGAGGGGARHGAPRGRRRRGGVLRPARRGGDRVRGARGARRARRPRARMGGCASRGSARRS